MPSSCKLCEKQPRARGLCYTHYKRWQRHGNPTTITPRNLYKRKQFHCNVEGCERPHKARGFCIYHWRLWRRNGKPERLPEKKDWGKGKTWITKDQNGKCYRMCWANGQTFREHRYIMEQHLGRKLLSTEHVHHIDGNTLNNDLSNLQVLSQSDHIRLHRLDEWHNGKRR